MSNFIDNELKESKKYNLTKTDNLLDLMVDNVAKVEAMIRNDSTYRKASSKLSAPNGKYKGSTAYWIAQFDSFVKTCSNNDEINKTTEYINLIRNIIEAIDRENITHLNSDKVGIDELTERVCLHNLSELIKLLKNPSPEYLLIKELSSLTYPTSKSIKGYNYKARENFSFATKFCHYMAFYLFAGTKEADNFSIYDNVLDKAIRFYKDDTISGNKHQKKIKFEGNYSLYISFIDSIISNVGNHISRNGFDHLLWYYYKGE